MSIPPREPPRADFNIIPGTDGVVGSPDGVVLRVTTDTPLTASAWGDWSLETPLLGGGREAIAAKSVLSDGGRVNTLTFALPHATTAAWAALGHQPNGKSEFYDIIREVRDVREVVVRGIVNIILPLPSLPPQEEPPQ